MRKLTTECPLERSAEIISGKWKKRKTISKWDGKTAIRICDILEKIYF